MSANGLIGIFVPYPYAAKDHQYYNALHFTKQGLGLLLRESQLDMLRVFTFIESLQKQEDSLLYFYRPFHLAGQGYHPFSVKTEVQIFQGSPLVLFKDRF